MTSFLWLELIYRFALFRDVSEGYNSQFVYFAFSFVQEISMRPLLKPLNHTIWIFCVSQGENMSLAWLNMTLKGRVEMLSLTREKHQFETVDCYKLDLFFVNLIVVRVISLFFYEQLVANAVVY